MDKKEMRLLSGHMTVNRGHLDIILASVPRITDSLPDPTHYATSHAQADLTGSGIACPPFRDYSDRLVSFMRAHPDVGSAALV